MLSQKQKGEMLDKPTLNASLDFALFTELFQPEQQCWAVNDIDEFLSSPSSSDDSLFELSTSDSSPSDSSPSYSPPIFQPVSIFKQENKDLKSVAPMKPTAAIKKQAPVKTKSKNICKSKNESIIFTRNQLLQMTSEEFEDRVASIENKRALTSDEMNEVKRQRRLIKNRESANASRVRKRQQMETMDVEIKELQQRNLELQKRVELLEKENAELRKLAQQNTQTYQKDSDTSFLDNILNSPIWFVGKITEEAPNVTTSACLFIFLLSFGIFFGSIGDSNNNILSEVQFNTPSSFSGYVVPPSSVKSAAGSLVGNIAPMPIKHRDILTTDTPPVLEHNLVELESFSFHKFAVSSPSIPQLQPEITFNNITSTPLLNATATN